MAKPKQSSRKGLSPAMMAVNSVMQSRKAVQGKCPAGQDLADEKKELFRQFHEEYPDDLKLAYQVAYERHQDVQQAFGPQAARKKTESKIIEYKPPLGEGVPELPVCPIDALQHIKANGIPSREQVRSSKDRTIGKDDVADFVLEGTH